MDMPPTSFRRRTLIEELEPRLLFSADLAPLVLDGLHVAPEQRILTSSGEYTSAASDTQPATQQTDKEVVFVDTRVQDYEQILADIQQQNSDTRSVTVVLIDPSQDGIAAITDYLGQHQDISAIHLISHGADDLVQLGSANLTLDSLAGYAPQVTGWGNSLTSGADILLYGCDVAQQADGRALVNALSQLTGADVAASTDLTGNAASGGDWTLEYRTGVIETASAISASEQQSWSGTLAVGGPELLVNTTTANEQTTDALNRGGQQTVSFDDAGNFVVVWTSKSQDGDGYGVYARRYAADGTALTGEILVNTTTNGDQMYASVASDAAGNFVVTWTSDGQDGNKTGVYARRFAGDGTALTGEILVNTTTSGDQQNSVIGMNRVTGDFVIAWQGQGTGDSQGIFYRRFAANGTALDGSEQRANSTDAGAEENPAVAMDTSGNFVIAYDVNNHLYFQRFNASGMAQGSLTQVDNGFSHSVGASIAMDGAGNFTLVYRETTTLSGIWCRGYNADGSSRYGWNYIATGDADSASIAMAADGSFIVTYQKNSDSQDIFAQLFNASGSANGSVFKVNAYTTNDQKSPSVALRDGGHFVVVWSGKLAADTDSDGVAARIYAPANTAPVITSNGSGDTASTSIAENAAAVTTVTATDADLPAQTLIYSISGGADADKFAINSSTGALSFVAAPNYEAPADANGDNTYEVIVQVSDGSLTDTQAISVSVSNVNEAPVASNDLYAVDQNLALSVPAASGMLANDSDPEGDPLSVASVSAPAHGTLSLIPAAMTVFTNLTNNAAQDTRADWSPDGTRIVFDTARDGNNEIYVMNADGTGLVRLTNNGADDSQPAWSPDGSKIAFMSDRSGTYEVWVMNADGSGLTQLTNVGGSTVSGQPAWSPDGSKIAFTSDRAGGSGFEIYVMNANGSSVTKLTTASGDDSEPAWSPDGSKIVFSSTRDGNSEIYVMNADGSGQTRLTNNSALDRTPVWSPDGSKIAYSSNLSGTNQIYIMDANGANQTAVTSAPSAVSFPDWSPDGQTLLFTCNNEVQSANVVYNGAFVYTPMAGYTGPDSFTYTVTDGLTSTATVNINVNAVNLAPTTTPVTLAPIAEDSGPLVITQADLLANAGDPNGDSLTAMNLAISSGAGAPVDNGDGTWTYTPAANDDTSASFSYIISDGSLTSAGSASLDITPVNDAPAASNTSINATEDVTYSDALPAATDVEGDPITYALASPAANGTVAVNASGTYTYAAYPNYNGPDSFSYTVSDNNGGSNTYTVTVNVLPVNDAPVANNDSASGNEDSVISGNVLGNDADVENDALAAILVSGPANGSLTLNTDGSFNYTPNANFNGTDSFTYKANDGALDSNVATVTLTVNPVNDAPTTTPVTLAPMAEDSGARLITQAELLANASDIDGPALTAAGLVISSGSGSLADNGNGTWTYTPALNDDTSVSFGYSVTDGSLSVAGSALMDITPVNDAPVISLPASQPAAMNVPIVFSSGNGNQISINDVDAGSNPVKITLDMKEGTLSLSGITGLSFSNGTGTGDAKMDFTGTLANINAALNGMVYTPKNNYAGSNAKITVTVNDQGNTGAGGALNATSVTTISFSNVAPVAVADSYNVNEDNTLTVDAGTGVLANDGDANGDTITAAVVSGPAHGSLVLNADGSFTYTPNTNWNGTDSFIYTASDASLNSSGAAVSITVNPVNDAPTATPIILAPIAEDSGARLITQAELLTNASDVDGPGLAATNLVIASGNGTLTDNGDGTWTYTPALNDDTSVGFGYTVTDGSLTAAGTANLDITPVNDAPTTTPVTLVPIAEDSGARLIIQAELLTNASDVDGPSLAATGLAIASGSGTLTDNGDGTWSFTPELNDDTSVSFSYSVIDGSLSAAGSASLAITPVNDAPVAGNDSASGSEDNALTGNVLTNDTDIDSAVLTAALASGPSNGSLTLNTDGSFTYTPNADWNGTDSFTYMANDGGLDSNIATVTLAVSPVNDAPVASDTSINATEDVAYTGNLPSATDADGDTVGYALASQATNGTASVYANGSFSYAANANFNGSDSFAYSINDGHGGIATYNVSVNVAAVNDAPTLTINNPSLDSGQTVTLSSANLQASDVDNTAAQLTYVVTALPANGVLALNGTPLAVNGSFTQADVDNGLVTYANNSGSTASADTLGLKVADPSGAQANGTLAIAIAPPPGTPPNAGAPMPDTTPAPQPDAIASEPPPEAKNAPAEPTPAVTGEILSGPSTSKNVSNEEALFAQQDGSASSGSHRGTGQLNPMNSMFNIPSLNTRAAYTEPLLASLNRALNSIASDTHALEMLQVSLGNNSFQQQLNQLQDEIRQQLSLDRNTVASTLAVSTGLSVGYVMWLVRGGVLLSSLMSSLPAWRLIDPLPILGHLNRQKKGEADDDSLEGMLKKSSAKPRPTQPTDGPDS
jgi:VCBS repeat-containing protein